VIVLIIVVVLGVLSCGASLLRSDEQRPVSTSSIDPRDLRSGSLSDLLADFGPPSEPLQIDGSMTNCPMSSGNLQPGTDCEITIDDGDVTGSRRRLLLRMQSGAMTMEVSGTSRGEVFTSDEIELDVNDEDASLVLSEGDVAIIELSCQGLDPCVVLINPTPPPAP